MLPCLNLVLSGEIILNQQGFLGDNNKLDFTFKEIAGLLYLEYILHETTKKTNNFKTIEDINNIDTVLKEYKDFYENNYKI